MEIDHKQDHLIRGWMIQAQSAEDPYFRFMSLWVAFNALCYALFHKEANRQQADLKKWLSSQSGAVEATVVVGTDRIEIDEAALQLKLKLSEKYTEAYIFSKFAKAFQGQYAAELRGNSDFNATVDSFRESIRKPNGFYVLNLSRKDHIDVLSWPNEQIEKSNNVLSSFHEKQKLSLLKDVLYQIRCNVFHGAKLPGDLNDDRVVRAASPVLKGLLDFSLPQ